MGNSVTASAISPELPILRDGLHAHSSETPAVVGHPQLIRPTWNSRMPRKSCDIRKNLISPSFLPKSKEGEDIRRGTCVQSRTWKFYVL